MAQPTDRDSFKEWCLRKLGKPVIEINVDATQIDDRVDEALSYYWDYHFDGTEKMYTKVQLTQEIIDQKWIPVLENVIGVVNLFPISGGVMGSGMFSARYQFVLNNINEFTNYNMINYYMSFQNLGFMQELLIGQQPIRYNRHMNKLYIDMDWNSVAVGDFIVYECYQIVDPDVFTDVWKDRWLQSYATAKIQESWGRNLTKFSNMQLPGGIQFNGEKILDDAITEIRRLEDEMLSSYSLPIHDLVG